MTLYSALSTSVDTTLYNFSLLLLLLLRLLLRLLLLLLLLLPLCTLLFFSAFYLLPYSMQPPTGNSSNLPPSMCLGSLPCVATEMRTQTKSSAPHKIRIPSVIHKMADGIPEICSYSPGCGGCTVVVWVFGAHFATPAYYDHIGIFLNDNTDESVNFIS